jgi:hypothetical protein
MVARAGRFEPWSGPASIHQGFPSQRPCWEHPTSQTPLDTPRQPLSNLGTLVLGLGHRYDPPLLDLVDWGRLLWQNVLAVDKKHPRMARESKTVAVMIDLYCRSQHGSDRQCDECEELRVYANERLEQCPFQEGKTTCTKCPVHCFKPAMRDKIKSVMRYSGPRMLHRHPILAIGHFMDRSRKAPISPPQKRADRRSE